MIVFIEHIAKSDTILKSHALYWKSFIQYLDTQVKSSLYLKTIQEPFI